MFGLCKYIIFRHSFQLTEIHQLVAYRHIFIQTSLLWHVSHFTNMTDFQRFIIDEYFAAVWLGNLIDNSDERSFPCTIRAEKPINTALWNFYAKILQSDFFACIVGFSDVFCSQHWF